jgi:DNA-directed RNA polymerase specialized sigma24 family protein
VAGLATRGLAADEAALARRAAAGDAESFATLYERYESRIYNLCYRVLGYQDGAATATREAFLWMLRGADPFVAARTACYELIEGPSVLREARTKGIRVANLTLPEPQREVLVLRELEGLSHDEIAEIMGTDPAAVVDLICRARIKLRDSLRAVPGPSWPDCDWALRLIAFEQDGALGDAGEAGWLREHLMRCGSCRRGRDAMQEACDAYRAWRPIEPQPQLVRETMAAASELVGADWTKAIARHDGARAPILRHPRGDLALMGLMACLLLLAVLAGRASDDDPMSWGVPAVERAPPPERALSAQRAPAADAEPPARAVPKPVRPTGPRKAAREGSRPDRRRGRSAKARGDGAQARDRARRGGALAPAGRRKPRRVAPEPAPRRERPRRQARVERRPDRGGQEDLVQEVAPQPAPPPQQVPPQPQPPPT